MGACSFMTTGYGKDYKDAYNNLVKDYKRMYGENPYNGTISTTYGCSLTYCDLGKGDNWTKTKEGKAYQIANKQLTTMEKGQCRAIDLGKVSNRITHHNGWHKFLFFGWAAE